MTSPRSLPSALLITALVGVAFFAWNRHLKVRDLATDLEQHRLVQAELRAELRAARQAQTLSVAPAASPLDPAVSVSARPRPSPTEAAPSNQDNLAAFHARMQDPAFQATQRAHARAMLDSRYADLFRRLNLSPDRLEHLRNLLLERDTVNTDVTAAATAAGLNFRDHGQEIAQLRLQAQEEIDAGIAQVLGPEGYATYQFHQQTGAQRLVVTQLEQRLSYSGVPLTTTQGDQLIQLLVRTGPDTTDGSAGTNVVNIRTGAPPAAAPLISDEAIAQAAAILSPSQLEALRDCGDGAAMTQ
jgi:hypothetical protein